MLVTIEIYFSQRYVFSRVFFVATAAVLLSWVAVVGLPESIECQKCYSSLDIHFSRRYVSSDNTPGVAVLCGHGLGRLCWNLFAARDIDLKYNQQCCQR